MIRAAQAALAVLVAGLVGLAYATGTDDETMRALYWVGSVLVPLAAFPAVAIVYTYERNLPWRRSVIGRVWMRKSRSIALVLVLSTIGLAADLLWDTRDVLWFMVLRVGAFAYVTWALYSQRSVMKDIIDQGRTAGDAVQAETDRRGEVDPRR